MSQRRIEGDPIQPSEEAGFAFEAIDGLKGLDEGVLSQIRGVFPIGCQIVDDRVDTLPIFQD